MHVTGTFDVSLTAETLADKAADKTLARMPEELTGLTGTMEINAASGGRHSYDFEYTFTRVTPDQNSP